MFANDEIYSKLDLALKRGLIGEPKSTSQSSGFIRGISGKYLKVVRNRLGRVLFNDDGPYFAWSLLWLAILESEVGNKAILEGTVVGLSKVQAVNNRMTLGIVDKSIRQTSRPDHPGFLEMSEAIGIDVSGMLGYLTDQRVEYLDKAVRRCLIERKLGSPPNFVPLALGLMGRDRSPGSEAREDPSNEEIVDILDPLLTKYYPFAVNNISAQVNAHAYAAFCELFETRRERPIIMKATDCGRFMASVVLERASCRTARTIAERIGYRDKSLLGSKKKALKLVIEHLILQIALIMGAANRALYGGEAAAKLCIDAMLDRLGDTALPEIEKIHPGLKMLFTLRMNEYATILRHDLPSESMAAAFAGGLGIEPMSNAQKVMSIVPALEANFSSAVHALEQVMVVDRK